MTMANLEQLRNPDWRINNLYSIIDKRSCRIKFNMNAVQQRVHACKKKRKAVLKARQFGISTYGIIKLFDDTIWNKNRTNVILAHEQDAIEKLFRIARRAYDGLAIKPRLDKGGGSKYEMFFPEINSRIYTDLAVRGDTISNLHVSEIAFFKEPQRLIATLQAVPLWGSVTLETTPNGIGNFFYDMWIDPDAIYEKLFFPWYVFPEYQLPIDKITYTEEEILLIKKAKKLYNVDISKEQIAFRRFKQKENGRLFIQEYPEDDQSCFLASGEAAFDLLKVSELMNETKPAIVDTGEFKLFIPFDNKKTYACGADTAEGIDGDYSVATIYEARSRKQAAVIRGHFRPKEFAHKINDLCAKYHREGELWPLLGVEENNHGHAVLLELAEHIHYPNLYYHDIKNDRPGWRTDKVTRPIMINAFRDGVENRTIEVNDKTTLGECLTLIVNSGKIEAAEGKHDDCVIASAIALQMCLSQVDLDLYRNIDKQILL